MTTTTWDVQRAAKNLGIELIPFYKHATGYSKAFGKTLSAHDLHGYSVGNEVAIRPGEQYPLLTVFHEMAHVVLGHTTSMPPSGLNQEDREVEAHAVAIALGNRLLEAHEWDRMQELDWLATSLANSRYYLHQAGPADLEDTIMAAAMTIYRAGR